MKKTYIIILFLLGLLALTTCHKDKEMEGKTPVVSNEEMTVADTQATISWKVDYVGSFHTGVDVSSHENMSEARRVEATNVGGKYMAVVDGLTVGTKYYYRIVVWNKYGSFEEETANFMTEEKTFYQVIATGSPADGGRVTGAGSYEENKYCMLNAIPNEGYSFVNWTESGNPVSTNANYTFKVTRNRNLVAHFAKQKFTVSLSVTPSGGGTVTGGGEYDSGQSCTVSATAASGYTFSKWTENGTQVSTNANYTFTVTGNLTLEAVFTAEAPNEYTITVSAEPSNGGTVNGGGTYQQGQSCTVTATANNGYTFSCWTENGIAISPNAIYSFSVEGSRELVANFVEIPLWPNGVLPGLFSVSDTQQVRFSRGNLQYQASTNTWRFAENQWNYCGGTYGDVVHGNVNNGSNDNPSSYNSNWIDLFRWGTSGYNHGAVCYQPWSTSITESDYYAYGNILNDLCNQTGMADWGYNAISNGGNQENFGWRTLTHEEWVYVFETRSTVSGARFAMAQVNGMNGLILLPDDWNANVDLNNVNPSEHDWSFSDNVIFGSQWTLMEQAGVVFFPAAGQILHDASNPPHIFWPEYLGDYWSASHYSSTWGVWSLGFHAPTNDPQPQFSVYFISHRYEAQSVRLVRNAN